jgi:hypothetical protein
MGNFSISHHSRIHVYSRSISITTIFDFAEIATFQTFPDPRKAAEHAAEWVSHLHLQMDGRLLPLQLQRVHSEIVPVSSGLPTLRVQLETSAQWSGGNVALSFRDENYSSRIGWKEIVVETDPSVGIPNGNLYTLDRTHGLTVYPEDLLSFPPETVFANFRVMALPNEKGTSRISAGNRLLYSICLPLALFLVVFVIVSFSVRQRRQSSTNYERSHSHQCHEESY